MGRHRILFLDAYDSFTNNIVSLLTSILDVDVHILHIDSPLLDPSSSAFQDDFHGELAHYSAVVCGPGPGAPGNPEDVGLMNHIWKLEGPHVVPTLGICLGFQSLVLNSGGAIRRLSRGLHGMARDIDHERPDSVELIDGNIFNGVGPFKATLYHSLCANIGQDEIVESAWDAGKWGPAARCPDIMPLAWTTEEREVESERILMAMKHKEKPFWGLQYHPESVCSDDESHKVIVNWFREALAWNSRTGRTVSLPTAIKAKGAVRMSLTQEARAATWTYGRVFPSQPLDSQCTQSHYTSRSTYLPPGVCVPDIVEILNDGSKDRVVLDSSNAQTSSQGPRDVRGRYSVIALEVDEAPRFEYHAGDDHVTARWPKAGQNQQAVTEQIQFADKMSVWHCLATFLEQRMLNTDSTYPSPFLGGFMGYVTYELGLHNIDVETGAPRGHTRPDLCFVWVTKSVVVDHVTGLVRIQHLQESTSADDGWIDSMLSQLETSDRWVDDRASKATPCLSTKSQPTAMSFGLPAPTTLAKLGVDIQVPDSSEYESKVKLCQDYIAAGESYELCLTDDTLISRSFKRSAAGPLDVDDISWSMFKSLRARQPVPFGSYLRLGGATLVSSSPERFLEHDGPGGLCSMRPMKGTVRKSLWSADEGVSTIEQAERILHVPKEMAENLMIVDLVRHDLHSVCGPGNVRVPRLMKVEEYASVFQMVSVVEGRLPSASAEEPGSGSDGAGRSSTYTGLDALAASLPPGSMTGAPKKRSCEILSAIESAGRDRCRERSLYSGVVGYIDVAGRGDWSVTIRCLFRWDDETRGVDDGGDGDGEPETTTTTLTETWHVGAGGAVTILSTPEGERDEMFAKLNGPLGIFGAAF